MPWSHRGPFPIAPRFVTPLILLWVVLAAGVAHVDGQPIRAASSTFVSDNFGRSVANGWASAATGGAYTIGGKAKDFSVGNKAGRMTVAAGVSRSAMLLGVWQRDIEINVRFKLDKRPTGTYGTIWIYAPARRISDGNEYLAKVRIKANGMVAVGASRLINGNETPIGTEVRLAAQYNAGALWNLKASFSQATPTQIGVSAWPASSSASSSWQYSAQDSTSFLQTAGSTGLYAYAASTITNAPLALSFEAYSVVAPASSPPSAISYYVSPSGSDGNAGTLGAPWRTLQKAADTVPAGATVYLRNGTYGPFIMRRSGTSAAPITFTAYGNESAVIDGKQAVAYTIRVVGAQNLKFTDLTIRGGYAEGYAGAGITAENSANIVIRNNLITDNKAWGVRLYNSTNITVDNNEVARNAVGIHVNLAGEGTTITNNRVHNNNKLIVGTPCSVNCGDDVGGEGIALVKSTGHVMVKGNTVWGNRAVSSDYGYDGAAFSIYGASNWTIRDNVTWDNRNVMETGTDANRTPCDNNTFVLNVNYAATTVDRTVGMVLRCASNMLVANNTFVGMQYFVFDIEHNKGSWGGSIDGLRILNNIISAPAKIYGIETWPLPASVVIDYNLVNRTDAGWIGSVVGLGGTSSFDTFRSWTGFESHAVTGDPRFVDGAGHDYHLRSDSPAVNSGRTISGVTDNYRGTAPDMGRYEY